jgi:small-conductance mechanosensitive channel/CRP-like cAMP-binding protein
LSWVQHFLAELDSASGVLAAITLLMTLALKVLLPAGERRRAVVPLALLILHLATLLAVALLYEHESVRGTLELIAFTFLLVAFARSGFLLVVRIFVARRLTRPLPQIFQDVLQALVYMAVALVVLRAVGVEPGSLLTTSALLTAVVGLSLQDTLGNMFAGLAIQAQRPFDPGDWIQYGGQPDQIGKVVEMNWRAVTVRTLERVDMVVPNSSLADSALRNFSKPTGLVRREAFVWAAYDVPPHRVQQVLLDAVKDVPGVMAEPPPTVLAREFSDRGVQYWVRWFITDFERREPISSDVRERIWYAMHRAGIAITLPRRHVTLEEVTPERLAQARERDVGERERALSSVDILAPLPPAARRRLAEASGSRLYAPNEVIIREGQPGHELFIIQRGEVRVLVDRADMSIVEVARLGPGAFFGEMSLMTGEPRRATVRSLGECEVIVVTKDALQPLLGQAPELAERISRKLAEREAELGARVAARRRTKDQSVEERTSVLLDRIRKFFHL